MALGLELENVPGQARGGVDHAFKQRADDLDDRIVAVRLASVPEGHLESASVIVHTGDAAGSSPMIRAIVGDVVQVAAGSAAALAQLRVGDEVEIDNRDLLAAETYHRHQVPGPEYPAWDQFRDASGEPRFPQRPLLLGPLFTAAAAGSAPTGEIKGKMILVESLWDREALPWQADWYRSRVREQSGDTIDDRFRLWYVDHALHGDSEHQEDPTHTVSYLGVLQQALRDLAAWVEQGIAPPASTNYRIDDAQVIVSADAEQRLGIQPLVSLTVDGGVRAEVGVGRSVVFDALIEVPPHTGTIVAVEWDFTGDATFGEFSPVTGTETQMRVRAHHTFDRPGTYFPVVRVASHRDGESHLAVRPHPEPRPGTRRRQLSSSNSRESTGYGHGAKPSCSMPQEVAHLRVVAVGEVAVLARFHEQRVDGQVGFVEARRSHGDHREVPSPRRLPVPIGQDVEEGGSHDVVVDDGMPHLERVRSRWWAPAPSSTGLWPSRSSTAVTPSGSATSTVS